MISRKESNEKILETLSRFLYEYPQMRFIQALWSLNIVEMNTDKFYEESEVTLKKVLNSQTLQEKGEVL